MIVTTLRADDFLVAGHSLSASYQFQWYLAKYILNRIIGFIHYRISFKMRDECWVSSYNQKIKAKGEIAVVIVWRYFSCCFDEWHIRISSVPSTHKKQVSEQLIAQVLPELRQRLIKAESEVETFDFKASFLLATGELNIL